MAYHGNVWDDEMKGYVASHFNAGETISDIVSGMLSTFNLKIGRNAICGVINRLRKEPGVITRVAVSSIIRMQNSEKRQKARKPKKERKKKTASLISHRYEQIDPPKTIAWEPVEGSLHVSLFALQRGQCAYPLSDGTYCGCRTESGSWCQGHYGRVWRKKTVMGSDKTSWR